MSSGYGLGDITAEAGAADKVRVQTRVAGIRQGYLSTHTVIGTLAT